MPQQDPDATIRALFREIKEIAEEMLTQHADKLTLAEITDCLTYLTHLAVIERVGLRRRKDLTDEAVVAMIARVDQALAGLSQRVVELRALRDEAEARRAAAQ